MELKHSQLIYIVREMLSPSQCDLLINEYENRKEESKFEKSDHAITNQPTQSTFMKVELIPETETFNIIHNNTEELINKWIDYLDSFNSFHTHILKRMMKYSHSYRLIKYETGGWIHPHIDWEHFTHASATFNLNDSYSGGEFSFFNGRTTVKLNKGDAMIFPADPFWVHEVKPITSGARYSTNSFICSLPKNLKEHISSYSEIMGESPEIKNHWYYASNQNSIIR
jgi:hypothetical protein